MIKNTFNITAADDGSITLTNGKPYFNKLESGVTKLVFTLPNMEGYAYLLCRHDRREFFAIPIITSGSAKIIMMGQTVTQYHGRWAFNICITQTELKDLKREDTAIYMSDTFEGLVYDNIADATPATYEPNTLKLGNDLKFMLDQVIAKQTELDIKLTTATSAVSNLSIAVNQAAGSATSAASSATAAANSATAAAASISSIQSYADSALASKNAASSYAGQSNTHAQEARASADQAAGYLVQVENLKDQAVEEATEAATEAATAAAEIAVENVVEGVKTDLQAYVDSAETKANAAAASATSANNYSTSAGKYASAASTSATNASTSASTASTKASEASTSATNASASATAAASSASAAENSANEAAESVIRSKKISNTTSDTYVIDSDEGTIHDIVLYGKSEQCDNPSPSNPQTIHSVANPKVTTCGKNLLNYGLVTSTSKTSNGITCKNNGDGSFTFSGIATANAYFTATVSIAEGSKAIQLFNASTSSAVHLALADTSGSYFYDNVASISNLKHTVTKSIGLFIIYIKYDANNASNNVVNNFTIKPMVEMGISYNDYAPYESSTASLSGITLRSIGDIRDYVDVEKGVVVRKIGAVDLGTLQIQNVTNVRVLLYPPTNCKIPTNNDAVPNILAKTYRRASYNTISNRTDDNIISIASNNWLGVRDTSIATEEQARSSFIGVMLIYELATPTEESLTQAQIESLKALRSYYPCTNVLVTSDDLDGSSKYSYVNPSGRYAGLVAKDVVDTNERIDTIGKTYHAGQIVLFNLASGDSFVTVHSKTNLPKGVYLATASVTFRANGASGVRDIKVTKMSNGNEQATTARVSSASSTNSETLCGTHVISIDADGGAIYLHCKQNSGSNVELPYPTLEIVRIM